MELEGVLGVVLGEGRGSLGLGLAALGVGVEEGADAAVENVEVHIFGRRHLRHAHVLSEGVVGATVGLDPLLEGAMRALGLRLEQGLTGPFGFEQHPLGVTLHLPVGVVDFLGELLPRTTRCRANKITHHKIFPSACL
ncbi:MAG: hypothetical protein LDL44_01800 [Caenispirillum sp.]|nr:hypothetical protein [Caenispirillum sp.]